MLGQNLLPANTAGIDTDISGWTANFNCTVARVISNYRTSPACGQMTTTSAAPGVCNVIATSAPSVTAGLTYTMQAWLRLDSTTGKLARIKLSPADGTFTDVGPNFISPDVTLTTSYQKLEVSGVIPVGATQAALVLEVETTVAGELADYDDILLAINLPIPMQRARQAASRSANW